jgi:hypothetical protein
VPTRIGFLALAVSAAAVPFLLPSARPAASRQGTGTPPPPTEPPGLPLLPTTVSTADSNGDMIAVTGVDRMGESILYLVDTKRRQLAVYQASGGSRSSRGVRLLGARRIDLDLWLYGYNDESEYSYRELERLFRKREGASPPTSGLDVGDGAAVPR